MPRNASPQDDFYRSYVRRLVKDTKADAAMTYEDLADALRKNGVHIDAQVLTNRINRGAFTLAFAFQLFAALGIDSIEIPGPPRGLKRIKR